MFVKPTVVSDIWLCVLCIIMSILGNEGNCFSTLLYNYTQVQVLYCILYTVYSILYTVYCILYTVYCIPVKVLGVQAAELSTLKNWYSADIIILIKFEFKHRTREAKTL